jgi:hypothetical protein
MAIWRIRIACWVPNVSDTHTECVMLIVFPLQQWSCQRASMLPYTHIACLDSIQCHVMVQVMFCWSYSAQTGFDPRPVRVRLMVGKVTSFSPNTSASRSHYRSNNAPFPSSSTFFSYQKDKWTKPGNLTKRNTIWKLGEWKTSMNFQFLRYLVFQCGVSSVLGEPVLRIASN